jgi:hypothetical protein
VAPLVGLDWLITRTHGGMYVSLAQAFLTAQGAILNGPTSSDTGFRQVDVKNLRRFDLMAVAFPGSFVRWHPYVGAGFAFNYITDAEAPGPFTQQKQIDYARSAVSEVKAAIGPAFIAGAQFRFRPASLYAQVLVYTMNKDFLLANGHPVSISP